MAAILSLPPELVYRVLAYLPLRSLLAFSRTCRTAHEFASSSIHTISLGIFPSRIASLMGHLTSSGAYMGVGASSALSASPYSNGSKVGYVGATEVDNDGADPYSVSVIMPSELAYSMPLIISFQSSLASSVISRYARTLRHLDLTLWSMTPQVAAALSSARNLRSLSLRLEHPYVRHRHIDRRFWERMASEGSTVWNTFAGAWKKLHVLRLEGAGLTDWQLQKIIETNTDLREIWIAKCPLLGADFWEFIGRTWEGKENLAALGFIGGTNPELNEGILKYITGLTNLEFLSLYGCTNIKNDEIKRMNDETWHVPELVLPQTPSLENTATLEVDPAFEIPNKTQIEPPIQSQVSVSQAIEAACG